MHKSFLGINRNTCVLSVVVLPLLEQPSEYYIQHPYNQQSRRQIRQIPDKRIKSCGLLYLLRYHRIIAFSKHICRKYLCEKKKNKTDECNKNPIERRIEKLIGTLHLLIKRIQLFHTMQTAHSDVIQMCDHLSCHMLL